MVYWLLLRRIIMIDAKYVVGTPTIARFDFTRGNTLNDKTQKRIELAAECFWNMGYGEHGTDAAPVLFSSLTRKQLLEVVADRLEHEINSAAKNYLIEKRQQEAAIQADAEANTDY
jgi:hypothetical protein